MSASASHGVRGRLRARSRRALPQPALIAEYVGPAVAGGAPDRSDSSSGEARRADDHVYVLAALVGCFISCSGVQRRRGAQAHRARPVPEAAGREEVETAKLYDKDNLIKGELDGDKFEITFPAEFSRRAHQMTVAPRSNSRRQPEGRASGSPSCSTSLPVRAPDRRLPLLHEPGCRAAAAGHELRQGRAERCPRTPKVTFADVAGLDEAVEELHEIRDFLEAPPEVPADRGQDPQGRPAVRPAGHRQDAAGPGGGRRGRRALLLHLRVGFRRDVRRRRRAPGPRPVRAGQGGRARHRVRRRDRRRGPPARRRPRRRPRRAGADPQPAARRDGRLRHDARASSSSPPPTAPTSSTPPCCGRAGSTARS